MKDASLVDQVYNISRCGALHQIDGASSVPPWGTFQAALVMHAQTAISNISFNPIIMAKSIDPSTVYEPPTHLVNFFNGAAASPGIETSLLQAFNKDLHSIEGKKKSLYDAHG